MNIMRVQLRLRLVNTHQRRSKGWSVENLARVVAILAFFTKHRIWAKQREAITRAKNLKLDDHQIQSKKAYVAE